MDSLLKIALVGTAKHTAPLAADDHPAAALCQLVASDDREHYLLLRAGVRAVCEQCGLVARTGIAALPPAPDAPPPILSAKLVELLQAAISGDSQELLVEFANGLRDARLELPPESVPAALALRDSLLREAVRPILGERGRWLSQFNADWDWAHDIADGQAAPSVESLKAAWDDGRLAERQRVLTIVHHLDPAAAREWLEAAFAVEKADQRAALLEAFVVNASPDDEPILEARLDDRSEAVRRCAALALARLPGSALAERMRARAEAMLTAEKTGWLRRGLKLVCNPPEEIDAAWERDAIAKQPPGGQGKRAHWAQSVVALVPPSHWSQKFAAEPAALISAVKDDPYADAVLAGWSQAAVCFAAEDAGAAAWLRPLFDQQLEIVGRGEAASLREAIPKAQALLAGMASADAETAVREALESIRVEAQPSLLQLLPSLRTGWSPRFSNWFLIQLRGALARHDDARPSPWLFTLSVAALALPPQGLSAALEPWSLPEAGDQPADKSRQRIAERELDKFRTIVERRHSFYTALQRRGQPRPP